MGLPTKRSLPSSFASAPVQLDIRPPIPPAPPAFEMIIVGCGGGPSETNLSSYLLKPYAAKWDDGCLSLEGGSALGAISRIVEEEEERGSVFREGWGFEGMGKVGREGGGRRAGRVWEGIRAFLITHAHLDHILGLVTSSGASLAPKYVYGTKRTIANLERVFDGGVWPALAGWERELKVDEEGREVEQDKSKAFFYKCISAPSPTPIHLPSLPFSFTAFPLAHGMDPSKFHPHKERTTKNGSSMELEENENEKEEEEKEGECYDSTAFFVKACEREGGREERELLFFGDTEPDSISRRGLNLQVWKAAAPKIVGRTLDVIFLECSYPSSQPTAQLWGHLSPPFVLEELRVLANLVRLERIHLGADETEAAHRPLAGVTVVIIHIKDDVLPLPLSSAPLSPEITLTLPPLDPLLPAPVPLHPPTTLPPFLHSTARSSLSYTYGTLSMSPPLPTVPKRRASGGGISDGLQSSGRRSISGLSAGSSSGAGGSASGWRNPFVFGGGAGRASMNRRASVPSTFMMGSLGRRGSTVLEKSVSAGAAGAGGGGVGWKVNWGKGSGIGIGIGMGLGRTEEYGIVSEVNGMWERKEGGNGNGNGNEDGFGFGFGEKEEEEEETEEETVHERIERELNELEEVYATGVTFWRARQGARIVF